MIFILMLVSCKKTEIANPERDIVQIGKLSVDKQVFINRYRLSKDFAKDKYPAIAFLAVTLIFPFSII